MPDFRDSFTAREVKVCEGMLTEITVSSGGVLAARCGMLTGLFFLFKLLSISL